MLRSESVRSARIEIAVVDDRRIARLNRIYLRHNGPTDVLAFDLSGPGDAGLAGQVIVSAETARRQAKRFGHPIAGELALYVVHGLLHLLGYDDHRPRQRRRMHARQAELLAEAGYRLRG